MKISILAIAIAMSTWAVCAKDEFVQSTVAICVLDQTGAPITNANVSVNSYTLSRMLDGTTDTNGVFLYTDRIGGEITCRVYKNGYYPTHGNIWSGPHTWTNHPTSEFFIVLKKIITPAPMNFNRIRMYVPRLDEPVAFDLEIGDWVEPDGKGKVKDLVLIASRRMASRFDHDVKVLVRFSRTADGIQDFTARRPYDTSVASDLVPPQEAPISGYTNECALWQHAIPGHPFEQSWQKDRNHIFRIRSKTDAAGKIVAANYGWTEGDFQVDPGSRKTVYIEFNYYYNPDSTSRSLEPRDIADRAAKENNHDGKK